MAPAHAIARDKEQSRDSSSSAADATIIGRKSDTGRSPHGASSVWDRDQLQEARPEKTTTGHKEGVIEGQYAIPLILQDDELLEAQQGVMSASAVDDLALTAGDHDELIYDQVFPLS